MHQSRLSTTAPVCAIRPIAATCTSMWRLGCILRAALLLCALLCPAPSQPLPLSANSVGGEGRWLSPCNEKAARPHVTKSQAERFSSLKPSTPDRTDALALARQVITGLDGTSRLVHAAINQTETRLGNPEHISILRGQASFPGLQHSVTLQEGESMDDIVPVISSMYNTLTRIAIFLDSVRVDLGQIRDTEERQQLLTLLRTLEQGGEGVSGANHYGIYNQLCDMYLELPGLLGEVLEGADSVVPAEHHTPSRTQAEARDRHYRVFSAIHRTLLQLINNAAASLPATDKL